MLLLQQQSIEKNIDIQLEELRKAVSDYKDSSDKVRRGIYARDNVQDKKIMDIHMRLEVIERYLCKGA